MHTNSLTDEDGHRTQVGPDPLDYVLRYAASDYDCYHQGRYIGSRATLPKAVEAVQYEQAKAARHPQPALTANAMIAAYQDELRAVAERLQALSERLASCSTSSATTNAQLTLAHIRIRHSDQEPPGCRTFMRAGTAHARYDSIARCCLIPRNTLMSDESSASVQHCTGQVRAMFYLLDEPTTTLTLQISGQTITVRAYDQVAQDLRALPRGATICATLHDAPPDCPQLIAFTVIPSWL